LEAMAVGCAVILCDARGLGGLVRKNYVATLREWNFGMRCLHQPATPGLVLREMLAYDAADAAAVTAYIRENASLDQAVDRYISLYEEVLPEKQLYSAPIVAADVIGAVARRAGDLEDKLRVSSRLFMPPLPASISNHLRVRISSCEREMEPGSRNTVRIRIRNDSRDLLASIGPHPVHCSYHWLSALTRETVVFDGQRTRLTADVRPGSEHDQGIKVLAPDAGGDFILRVTLVQEGVFWFDQLHPPVAAEGLVAVSSSGGQPVPPRFSLEQAAEWHDFRIIRKGWFSNLGFANDPL